MTELPGNGAGFEHKRPFRNHSQDVASHRRTLQHEADFRGEQQPFQLNPTEQQASERLGKPPPVVSTVVNREQIREQKIQEAIEKLVRGEITVDEYHEISKKTHIESLGAKETKPKKSELKSLFRRKP